MASFLRCDTIDSTECLGGRLTVMHVAVRARQDEDGLADAIAPLVARAVATRMACRSESGGDRVAGMLEAPMDGDSGKIHTNDMKGLIGEIVAEAILVECGLGEPLYSKWRHGGTSFSRGADMVLRRGDWISANESKHLHTPRHGNDASPNASVLIVAAFRQNTDARTRKWLDWLRHQLADAERLMGAMQCTAGSGAAPSAARIIGDAMDRWTVSINAAVVFDARYGAGAGTIGRRMAPATLHGIANPAVAVVARIEGLHEATAKMIGRYC